ncbi:MAG: hypothetical protein WBZ37_15295 [Mycobacterium sp.]
MAGPHTPNHAVGANGPTPYRESPPLEFPEDPTARAVTFGPASPKRRSRRRLIIGMLVAVALAAAMTMAVVYGVRTNGANTGAAFSEASAKTAIQGYLDALEHRDTDGIVRNALCGMYDGVRDKRTDQALAKLGSDAFRKQFSQVELTSIDKIVYLSQYQAQALFTMQVSAATGGPMHGQVQGVAQLLFQRGQILVCSYVLRTGSSY